MARVESLTADQIRSEIAALLASPALTGTPTAPTPSPGDNDQSIATTAFVVAALGASNADNKFWITIGAPGSGLGIDGDIAFDKNSGNFYQKIAGLGWGLETSFVKDLNDSALKNTLLTTKGDLIARGASGPLRRSIGSNGQFLQADSAQVTGMKWGTPVGARRGVSPKAGWYMGPDRIKSFVNASNQFDTYHRTPVYYFFEQATTIDQIAVRVDTLAAGASVYVAIWDADAEGYPVGLWEERNLGTMSATGVLAAAVTHTFPAGSLIACTMACSNTTARFRGVLQDIGLRGSPLNFDQALTDAPRFEIKSSSGANITGGTAAAAGIPQIVSALPDNAIWVGMRRAA
jgi:hypothetical protein